MTCFLNERRVAAGTSPPRTAGGPLTAVSACEEVQRGGCGQFGPISAEFFGPNSQTESIGSDGKESTDSYDCVSFRSQTDCAAYTWSVTGGGSMTPQWMAANCPHTTSSNVVDAAAPRAVGLLALLALLFSA